jgi:hypothetical protein
VKLPNFSEYVGTLEKYSSDGGQCHLFFVISERVSVPADAICQKSLEQLVGKKIGVINADGKYRLRKITK